MNRIEKIIKREDGRQLKITVEAFTSNYSSFQGLNYNVLVHRREKGKKKWLSPVDSDNYSWRSLSMEARAKWNYARYLELVSAEEIQSVALELWQSYKPKFA